MGVIYEEFQTDFTGGVSGDPRSKSLGVVQIATNFDIFRDEKRAIPYNDSESGDASSATSKKQAFDIGLWTPTPSWRLFALGVVSGTARAEILMKILTTGGATDLDDSSWATPANNSSAAGTTSFDCFFYYKTLAKFIGARAGTNLWTFTPDGATGWNDTFQAITYTNIAQGIVHSKDDIAYIPYDNFIASYNATGAVFNATALTLPADYYISAISEFGDFIAIACAPNSGVGKSRLFIWNRDSSLSTLSDSVDAGEGVIKFIEELEGQIVAGVMIGGNGTRLRDRVVFRKYAGAGMKRFKEITSSATGQNLTLLSRRQKADNRVYFLMSISIDGVVREGLWSIGMSSSGEFAISHERTQNNDTALGNGSLRGFFVVADYVFISYIDNAGSYQLSKTNDQASFTALSIIETVIKNTPNSDVIKKLVGASVMFEPLPAAGQIALYYKKNAETDWTRIFVYNTDNEISHGAVNVENDSTAFTVTIASPAVFTQTAHGLIAGQKIRFATTGALPTGLTVGTEYYVISTGLTSSTFRVSLTSGGSAVNTSGSQSGVHTINRTVNLTEGKEFKFRVESTGGAVPTGIRYKIETVDKQLY